MTRNQTLIALGLLVPAVSSAQARPPLPLAADSAGVLSALRAVDLRQLCRCRTVRLDSTVRIAERVGMFGALRGRVAGTISAADGGRLNLAGKRVIRTALGSLHDTADDVVIVAVQQVPTPRPRRQILIVANPPTGTAHAYLVTLIPRRTRWSVEQVQAVYDP